MNAFYEHVSDQENFFFLEEQHNCWINSHFHKSYEFVYIEEGDSEIFANDAVQIVRAGDAVCFPSYCVHYLKNVGDAKIFTLVFAENYFEDFVKEYGKMFFSTVLRDVEKNRVLGEMMRAFYGEAGPHGGPSYMRRKIFIDTVLCYLAQQYPLQPVSVKKQNQNICNVLAYIGSHSAEKLTLKTLAQKFNYNEKYFSAYFNRSVGMNLTSYVNCIRFNNAKLLMDTTSKSMTQIAAECGFESLATFYRVLKKFSGKTHDGRRKI